MDSQLQRRSTQAHKLLVHITLQPRQVERYRSIEFGYYPDKTRVCAEQMGGFQHPAFTLFRQGTWDEF